MKNILSLIMVLACATVANAGDPLALGNTLYERYVYNQCGRDYYGYRPVAAPTQGVAAAPANALGQPAGADNSISYVYNINYGQLPSAQGSTVYGYSNTADVYGNTDLGALYNMAIRLASDQATFSDKASKNALSLIAQEQRSRAKVAEILATGQVLHQQNAANVALAQALAAKPAVSVETTVHSVSSGTQTTVPQVAGQALDVQTVLNNRCVSCHKTGNEKAGLSMEDAKTLTAQDVKKILARIISPNPELRMPRNPDGTAGALSVEESAVLFKAGTN